MLRRRPDIRPRREREPGEFASFTPKPRTPAALTTVASALAVPEVRHAVITPTHASEREYMGLVASLGCVVCRLLGRGIVPCQVHHIREGQGGSQRAGNFCVIGLCEPHHTGPKGIHGDRTYMRLLKVDEVDLLDITIGLAFSAGGVGSTVSRVNHGGSMSIRGNAADLPGNR